MYVVAEDIIIFCQYTLNVSKIGGAVNLELYMMVHRIHTSIGSKICGDRGSLCAIMLR